MSSEAAEFSKKISFDKYHGIGNSGRRRNRWKSENIVDKIFDRQTFSGRPMTQWNKARQFYTCILPNMTVVNVERPLCFLRKFSPDGQFLIAFSGNQSQLEIFRYRGVTSAGQLLHHMSGVLLCQDGEYGSVEIRQNLFDTLFQHMHTIPVLHSGVNSQLNRECSLFTNDSRHVIVASAGPSPATGERFPTLFEFYQNNESLTPTTSLQMEDISIFSVDLQEGRVCDEKQFKCDKIALSHHQGLYIYQRLLAVLSVQHQTIHMFQIEEHTGFLVPLQSIGRFLFDNDEMHIEHYQMMVGVPSHDSARRFAPMAETVFTGLKHRIMTFLYRKASDESQQNDNDPLPLRRFYQRFEVFRWMRMWRMQMIDSKRFLIRYAQEDTVTYKVDPATQISWFVIYDWRSTKVLGVYDCYSPELMKLVERCSDQIRNPDGTVRFHCSVSSSQPAKDAHNRYKRTIQNAKGGGQAEMIRRVLAQYPISAQSYSSSPYLDLNLFSYDDKFVSMFERPKAAGDCAVRFYNRKTSQLVFQLHCGVSGRPSHGQKSLVAFIFHPIDPFCISVQRDNRGSYTVNFHLPGACMNNAQNEESMKKNSEKN